MRTRHFAYGLALLLFAGLAAPGHAATPSAFVTELVEKALLSANNKTLSAVERQQSLAGLVDENFDLPVIARYVLGDYWQTASQTERADFVAIFRNFVLRIYSLQLTGYDSESFRVVGQREESATHTLVYTEISRPASERPVTIGWRIVDKGGYRIIDMNVSSISMALTKRHEFESFLRRNGGDLASLIQQLK